MTWLSRWRNPQTWTLDYWFFWLFLTLVASFALLVRPQSDTWWLLRAGQDIVQQHTIPLTDTYSFTVNGGYWPNHEWLSEVLMYGVFAVGGVPLLVAIFALVILATWLGVYTLAEGAPRLRSMILLLGLIANVPSWSIRPQLISLALFVLTLHLIIKRRWWWLPVLFLLWANLHAGVAAGGILLGVATLSYAWFNRTDGLRLLVISGLSAAATLLNPLGWRLWTYAAGSTTSLTREYLQEWRSPSFRDPTTYPFMLMLALVVITVWVFRREWRSPRDWLLIGGAGVFAVMAIGSIRHAMFFDVLALPILTRWIARTTPQQTISRERGQFHRVSIGVLGISMLVTMLVLVARWQSPLSPSIIASVQTCPAPLFNTYEWGGELIWFVPQKPVFIDNRQDPYPDDIFLAAARAEDLGEYRELFEQYAIQCAVVGPQTQLATALQRDGWREMQNDGQLSVWQR